MKLLLLCSFLGIGIAFSSQFSELEHRYPPHQKPRSLTDTIIPVEHSGDLYSEGVDMLILSQYIYELAALRKHAKKKKETDLLKSLDVSKEHPKCLAELNQVLKANLHHIGGKGGEQEAIDAVAAFLSSEDKHDQELVHGTKHNHDLHVFADKKDDAKASRVHGIAVNKNRKRVEIVFRGTANVSLKNAWWDWSTNLKAVWRRKESNPDTDAEKDDVVNSILVHRGFSKVLLGSRKSKMRPIDKILQEDIKPLMQPGYRLYVSGHSLGGAIATLFGFYAAADPDLTQDGPVTIYTYAAPRVGDATFREACGHLERQGKLRHARFHNQLDKVPQLPWLAGLYKHVGMEVRLRKDEPPIVDYPVKRSWQQSGQGVVKSVKALPQALKNHSPEEMMKRFKKAKDAFLKSTLEHEYRAMWGI